MITDYLIAMHLNSGMIVLFNMKNVIYALTDDQTYGYVCFRNGNNKLKFKDNQKGTSFYYNSPYWKMITEDSIYHEAAVEQGLVRVEEVGFMELINET